MIILLELTFLNGISSLGNFALSKAENHRLIEKQINKLFKKEMNIEYVNNSNETITFQTDTELDELPF